MLRLNNLINLFKKNAFFTAVLTILAFSFSVFINYDNINLRLSSNNKIVTNEIANITKYYTLKLDLYSNILDVNPDLNELKLDDFSAFYYLDANGNVIYKNTKEKNDYIKKFVEINENRLKDQYYKSDLIVSEDYKSAVYFAKKISNGTANFLVAKLDLPKFLRKISKTDVDFVVVDGYGNILYSTDESKLAVLENINDEKYLSIFSSIYQSKDNATAMDKDSLVSVRSFILSSEFINYYFYMSVLLAIIFLLFVIIYFLDYLFLKNGVIKQINYCYSLQKTSKVDDFQNFGLIDGSDLLNLQLQTSLNVLENNTLKKEYNELEQRLSTMFSDSTIPMLLVDAYTAKIYKANQSALEFYNQKEDSITKMNIYMLGKKHQNGTMDDPINLANNMRNTIKNQGSFFETRHFLDNKDYKDVKIFPFTMRSDGFSCDILMILDSKVTGVSFEDVKNQYEALEKSFVANMDFTLESGKLKIKNYSKNIDKFLGHGVLNFTNFKDLLHANCLNDYKDLLLEIKRINSSELINYHKVIEQVLFLKQSNKRYLRCKANFVISKKISSDGNYGKKLSIVLYIAVLKQDILEEDVKNIISYDDMYRQTRSILCIVDKNFDLLSANIKFRERLGVQNINNLNLRDILQDDADEIMQKIKTDKKSNMIKRVLLKDSNNKLHPCEFSFITSHNAEGELVYNLVFKEILELARLDDFIAFCANKNINEDTYEGVYYEFYYNKIGNKIKNNEIFDNLELDELKYNLKNICNKNDSNIQKAEYLLKLIEAINTKSLEEIYKKGEEIFKGENNE